MLRDEVAAHYRQRGYTIRERVRVRGQSGAVHSVDMVAQGPLGNLVIALEDAGGFEGPEMHAVRTVAKDIGATPVLAASRIPEGLRRRAAEAGVVLLDASNLPTPEPDPVFLPAPDDDPYPPWPDPERRSPEGETQHATVPAGKSTDPGFWRYPRASTPDPAREPAGDSETSRSGKDAVAPMPRPSANGADGQTEPSAAAKQEGLQWPRDAAAPTRTGEGQSRSTDAMQQHPKVVGPHSDGAGTLEHQHEGAGTLEPQPGTATKEQHRAGTTARNQQAGFDWLPRSAAHRPTDARPEGGVPPVRQRPPGAAKTTRPEWSSPTSHDLRQRSRVYGVLLAIAAGAGAGAAYFLLTLLWG